MASSLSSSSLLAACNAGHTDEVAAILAGSRGEWAEQLDDALFAAIASSHRAIVKMLLTSGAKLNLGSFQMLLNRKNADMFQELLDHGLDINTREFGGEPALRLAVSDPALTQWLLTHGADPNLANERDVTPLATAAIMPVSPALDLLLANGATLDPDILHRAMRSSASGGTAMVSYLIQHGADVHYADPERGTPLHYAAYLGLVDEAMLLLDAGADPGVVINGYTPAALAKEHDNMEVHGVLSRQLAPKE